jgi:polysaccharide pyruvyl transferase WcaK-like protein
VLHVVNYEASGAEAYEKMHSVAKRFANDTARTYWETNHRIRNHSEADFKDTIKHYESADVVVSSALHGCIVGVSMGLKVLAVSGDRKIDAFMHSVGLSEWLLDLNEVSKVEELLSKIDEQVTPTKRLKEIRHENEVVAETIKTFLGGINYISLGSMSTRTDVVKTRL